MPKEADKFQNDSSNSGCIGSAYAKADTIRHKSHRLEHICPFTYNGLKF